VAHLTVAAAGGAEWRRRPSSSQRAPGWQGRRLQPPEAEAGRTLQRLELELGRRREGLEEPVARRQRHREHRDVPDGGRRGHGQDGARQLARLLLRRRLAVEAARAGLRAGEHGARGAAPRDAATRVVPSSAART
jgi:hypothetical protein